MKTSNCLKSLDLNFLFVDFAVRFLTYECWKSICLCLCYVYLMIYKETKHNINLKLNSKHIFS